MYRISGDCRDYDYPGVCFSGGMVHLGLDYVFIVLWDWGMKGAAWATLSGMAAVMVAGAAYFLFQETKLKFEKPVWDGKFVAHSMLNGSSEMVTESSAGITIFVFHMIVIRLAGEDGVAPLISYFYGAKEYGKVNMFLKYSRTFILWSSAGLAILCFCCAPYIAMAFEDPGTSVYSMAETGIRFLSGAFLFTGFNVFASGFFTAYGNGPISALISLSRALIMVVMGAVVLSWIFGLSGVWMTLAFAEIATTGFAAVMFRKYKDIYHYDLLYRGM